MTHPQKSNANPHLMPKQPSIVQQTQIVSPSIVQQTMHYNNNNLNHNTQGTNIMNSNKNMHHGMRNSNVNTIQSQSQVTIFTNNNNDNNNIGHSMNNSFVNATHPQTQQQHSRISNYNDVINNNTIPTNTIPTNTIPTNNNQHTNNPQLALQVAQLLTQNGLTRDSLLRCLQQTNVAQQIQSIAKQRSMTRPIHQPQNAYVRSKKITIQQKIKKYSRKCNETKETYQQTKQINQEFIITTRKYRGTNDQTLSITPGSYNANIHRDNCKWCRAYKTAVTQKEKQEHAHFIEEQKKRQVNVHYAIQPLELPTPKVNNHHHCSNPDHICFAGSGNGHDITHLYKKHFEFKAKVEFSFLFYNVTLFVPVYNINVCNINVCNIYSQAHIKWPPKATQQADRSKKKQTKHDEFGSNQNGLQHNNINNNNHHVNHNIDINHNNQNNDDVVMDHVTTNNLGIHEDETENIGDVDGDISINSQNNSCRSQHLIQSDNDHDVPMESNILYDTKNTLPSSNNQISKDCLVFLLFFCNVYLVIARIYKLKSHSSYYNPVQPKANEKEDMDTDPLDNGDNNKINANNNSRDIKSSNCVNEMSLFFTNGSKQFPLFNKYQPRSLSAPPTRIPYQIYCNNHTEQFPSFQPYGYVASKTKQSNNDQKTGDNRVNISQAHTSLNNISINSSTSHPNRSVNSNTNNINNDNDYNYDSNRNAKKSTEKVRSFCTPKKVQVGKSSYIISEYRPHGYNAQ